MSETDSVFRPVQQKIIATQLPCDSHGNPLDYVVGQNCDRIVLGERNGEYCMIPYVRVLVGEKCIAEFCQHKANYVLFDTAEQMP
jgi:hypothetical protein